MPTPFPLPSPDQWRSDLNDAFRDCRTLIDHLGLDPDSLHTLNLNYPFLVPRAYAAKIKPEESEDPLLKQVLPTDQELELAKGFSSDPVGDEEAEIVPGLLKKYACRVLILTTSACAVHCRFCFRRVLLKSTQSACQGQVLSALGHLEKLTDVNEVILSGGDPLMLADETLGQILTALNALPHIRSIRIHTRIPTVLPSRIQMPLVELIASSKKQIVLVSHVNHPQELGADTAWALDALRHAGAVLLNQSVLLRGVNDHASTLIQLSRALIRSGVVPYYLHQLDRVQGTHHFEVPVDQGVKIVQEMRAKCAGYLVPRYVREVPGEASKSPLT